LGCPAARDSCRDRLLGIMNPMGCLTTTDAGLEADERQGSGTETVSLPCLILARGSYVLVYVCGPRLSSGIG
jgi:hypothetical protein